MLRYCVIAAVVIFAVEIIATLALVLCYDLTALDLRWETISADVLDLVRDRTFWAVLITAELVAPVALLAGHLMLGQRIRDHATARERQRCAAVVVSMWPYEDGQKLAAEIRRPLARADPRPIEAGRQSRGYRPTVEGPPNTEPA